MNKLNLYDKLKQINKIQNLLKIQLNNAHVRKFFELTK